MLRLAAHLARLDRSCRELYGTGLPGDLPGRVRRAAATLSAARTRIRVLVVPDHDRLGVRVEAAPVGPPPDRLWLVRADRPAWCWRHKWADRTALGEPAPPAADGLLTLPYFLTPAGMLAESARGNLCVRTPDGVWVSPPESEHLLPGITRRDLLRALGRRGEQVRIDDVALPEPGDPFAVLHCSSVSGVRLVTAVDDRRCERGDRLRALERELNLLLGFPDL